MNIGIIHITDIHFSKHTLLGTKLESLSKVMINDFHDAKKVYLLLSGDIAFSGQKDQYQKAKVFIDGIRKIFNYKYPEIKIMPILIPGNHDCDFSEGSDVRNTILKNVSYDAIGTDNSFIDLSMTVQKHFWGFYGFYNSIPIDKLFYAIEDIVEGKEIRFICLNTAWMSKIKEDAGSIFFPVKRYNKLMDSGKKALNIGTWHHPINWFSPTTKENNKKEFQQFIESIAPIHFIGHEHEHDHYLSVNKQLDINTHILSGKQFNDDKKPNDSGFQTAVIELNSNYANITQYTWSDDHYGITHQSEFPLNSEAKRMFSLKKEISKELNDLKIPLLFGKKEVKLLDLFVFPDMEPTNGKNNDKLESYVDSKRLLDTDFSNSILDGDSQIGKTALLQALYLTFYGEGYFPIMITGNDFRTMDLTKIIKKGFQKAYSGKTDDFDKFIQTDTSKKILLIDDFQDSTLNTDSTKTILEEASKKFGKVIVTINSNHTLLPTMQSDFEEWKFFGLKPLGYKKRNDLIEAFHYLKEDPITFNEELFIEYTKLSFDAVQNILGNKLMPSYPVFILSILQALEYKPLQHQETSLGYCYQTLIHYSLANAGVQTELIDTFLNFLTELAYFNITQEADYISRSDYNTFYFNYERDFHVPNFEVVHKTLIKSKIIIEKDNNISFGYKYILYYLSAQKISDVLHKPEGREIIKRLFQNVHEERNANILVFVTHHSKDISFIEESMMNSMIVLDQTQPITLFKDDPFYNMIESFTNQVKSDVLEINRNPREERKRLLKFSDKKQREVEEAEKKQEESEDNDAMKRRFVPFQQSFRSIEIIGQIIRNRKGSLPKTQLHEMTKEIFTTGFRTVSFISEILDDYKAKIVTSVVNKSDEYESKSEIETRINLFIQMMCLQTCLAVFNKLMFSVGNKEMKDLFKRVAEDINTPAARLVTFGINSYYGNISINELKEISDELKGNVVAMNLLKSRVKSYVYNRKVDYNIKQQFASILKMTIGSTNKFSYDQKQNVR